MRLKILVALTLCISFSIPLLGGEEEWEGRLSQPKYKIKMEFNVPIPMRDGVKLSADIYRPDAEGKFPVLLTRTYYGKNNFDILHDRGREFIEYFVSRGYVVVVQDCHGRYDSEGNFYIEIYDAEDGYDTQTWCGIQPWSNGKIGTFGCSYGGCIQWYSAHLSNPYLKCMVPRDSTSDPYFDGGFMRNGVPQNWLGWCVSTAGRTTRRGQPKVLDWSKITRHLPLITMDESIGFRFPYWRDYLRNPLYGEYWERTSVRNKYHLIDVPTLNIGGWYSDADIIGTITNFCGVAYQGKTPEGQKSQKLLIGPWSHCSDSTKVGEIDFGEEAKVNIKKVHLRWYDYWLKGMDTGIMAEPPVKLFVMGANRWRYLNKWPPDQAKFTRYYLHSGGRANSLIGDGTLSTEEPGKQPPDRFVYDPENPVPSLFGDELEMLDQRPVERRDDVLVYTTPPLEEDVEVIGPIKLVLYASSSARDTDFTGKLVDVHPNEMARYLTCGIVRARYRETYTKPTLIEPGRIYKYEIDLWVTGNRFLKGHRIRLEVSSSHFPTFFRNQNTGNDMAIDTEMVIARQTIYHDSEHPSYLLLPIIRTEKEGK